MFGGRCAAEPASRSWPLSSRAKGTASAVEERKRLQRAPRHLIDLKPTDHDHLLELSERFGLHKSEVVRRLLSAALEVGPALSASDSQQLTELSHQLRLVGRNLTQMLRAVHSGQVPGQEETVEVWQGLHTRIREIDEFIGRVTASHGLRLRRSAKMVDRVVAP